MTGPVEDVARMYADGLIPDGALDGFNDLAALAVELMELAAGEQENLWDDLRKQLQAAHNGHWSSGAEWVVLRLFANLRLCEPTHWKMVPWALTAGGVYGEVLHKAGVPNARKFIPTNAELRLAEEPMESVTGLSLIQAGSTWHETVLKIRAMVL